MRQVSLHLHLHALKTHLQRKPSVRSPVVSILILSSPSEMRSQCLCSLLKPLSHCMCVSPCVCEALVALYVCFCPSKPYLPMHSSYALLTGRHPLNAQWLTFGNVVSSCCIWNPPVRLSNSFWILILSYFQQISHFAVYRNGRCQATSDGLTQVNEAPTKQAHRLNPYCVIPQVPESCIPFHWVSQPAWYTHGQTLPLFSWRPAGKLIWEATYLVPSLFDPKGRNRRAGAGNVLWPGDYRHRADPWTGSRVLPRLLHVHHFPVRFLQWGAIHRLWCPLHGRG